ncbi:MAG: tyrosine-type recombinase/integrase [Leptothrix sp. (in: b-proteobacteria)]
MPRLTKRILDAATADVWCSEMPGFGARVHPTGRRVFVARYRTQAGRQRLLTIGRASDLSVDQARDMAREVFAAVARGADPAGERAAARQAPTVADLADRYMHEHAGPYKKASSAKRDRWTWDKRILPVLGQHRVDAVTRADCVALHGALARSPSQANQTRALLSKAFGLAIEWGWRTTVNPVTGTKRFKMRQRETVLTAQQLAQVDAVLDTMTPPFAALVRLLTLTGCRLSEILTARREWVDIERRLLLLPDSKTGQRRIALPHRAIAIIQAMPAHEWLIPGRKPGTHMAKPYVSWYSLLKRAGLPRGTRIHDLRHTFGSHGHANGLSQRQIATMLGHSDLATTARYLHGLGDDASAVDRVAAVVTAGWRVTPHSRGGASGAGEQCVDRGQGPGAGTGDVGAQSAPRSADELPTG